NIPVYGSIEEAVAELKTEIEHCIIGIAPKGGKLPDELKPVLLKCMSMKMNVVSGLHDFISEKEEFVNAAKKFGVEIIDIRKPKNRNELHFWTGEIFQVSCPIVAVLGIETNLGKRTTTRILRDACRQHGIAAEMIFTGQTGWMQDGKYGFILDSTVNDFVAGELEHEIVRCYKEQNPQIIFLEGQAGLRNPSGPCGSEYLISGNAKKTILVFSPVRKYFSDRPDWGEMPSLESEIELIKMYGSEVIALVINSMGIGDKEAYDYQQQYEKKFGIPVLLPIQEGVEKIIPVLQSIVPPKSSATIDTAIKIS
ncbi:MAG TPA: DUF1611 domain-containing protein, partial [Parasegetibacter sp.]